MRVVTRMRAPSPTKLGYTTSSKFSGANGAHLSVADAIDNPPSAGKPPSAYEEYVFFNGNETTLRSGVDTVKGPANRVATRSNAYLCASVNASFLAEYPVSTPRSCCPTTIGLQIELCKDGANISAICARSSAACAFTDVRRLAPDHPVTRSPSGMTKPSRGVPGLQQRFDR